MELKFFVSAQLDVLIRLADQEFKLLLKANATEPYVHATYKVHEDAFEAMLLFITGGDLDIAQTLRDWTSNNFEDLRYQLVEWFWSEAEEARFRAENAAIWAEEAAALLAPTGWVAENPQPF